MNRFFLPAIAMGLLFFNATAQLPLYSHSKWFKVEDGLPQSFVSGLQEDQDGFLWISTRDGLARYDGRQFKIFRQNSNDSNSLSSNTIIDIYLDHQNLLWVFYINQKMDCFDPRRLQVCYKDSFTIVRDLLVKLKVSKFTRDHSGKFWFNTNYEGVVCFDPSVNKVTSYNSANKNLRSNNNLGLVENTKGQICVFTDKGLEILDKQATLAEEFIPFDKSIDFKFIPGAFNKVICLPDGKLILAETNRLIIFEPVKKTFIAVFMPPRIPAKQDVIHHLHTGKDGLLYAEAGGGVYRLEKNFQLTWLWQSENTNPFGNDARSFLVNQSGVVWFGTNGAGLVKIDLQTIPFTNIPYKNNFVTDNLLGLPGLTADELPALFKSGSWAYTFRYCYNASKTLFVTYAEPQEAPGAGNVYFYHQDKLVALPAKGNNDFPVKGLSISSSGALYAADRLGNIRKWNNINALPDFIPSPLQLTPNTGDVTDMEADDNLVWIATEKDGLYRIENGRVIRHYLKGTGKYDLPSNQLTDMCRDPFTNNKIWIGTLGQGLVRWNVTAGTEKVYTTDDGLPNNTIYSIVPDDKNNLWISTNNGICRLNPGTGTVDKFDVRDGLIGNEFNRFHHFHFPDGRIAFGGFEGSSLFDPGKFAPDTFATTIQFIKLLINNKPVEFAADLAGLPEPLNQLKKLVLPYNKNFLQFEFAGLQFNQPEKIRYRYMLKGYDKEWIISGVYNIAGYTRLPPGRYTLAVNASNTSGNWSPVIKELPIRIRPPLWATWWAYALYGLVALFLARAYWKYRENKIRMENEIALEHSKAVHLQEMDEIKNRFFSNITHELRSPLTLILTPLEKLSREQTLSSVHQQTIVNAHRNAEQLLRLINQLLDISKIESGQMKINVSAGDLSEFVSRCVDQFHVPAKEKNIRLTFDAGHAEGLYYFDEDKWEKIISNLLSNAIKFTPRNGDIAVSLKQTGEKENNSLVTLRVTDTGIGISEKDLPVIFNRFFMVDDSGTRSSSGTGIGLSLVKELTELMNGTINVKSEPGKGSDFTIELPVTKPTTPARAEMITNGKTNLIKETASATIADEPSNSPLLLVVEDNDELRSFMVESLSPNWRILQSPDGAAAWEIILKELPEIVISDVVIPGMTGFELCRRSKEDARTGHISFILLTAKAAHQSRVEGLAAGADEYVTKPFHFDELELRIQNLIKQQERWRKHLQEELLPEDPSPRLPNVNDIFIQHLYQHLDKKLDEPGLDVENLAQAMTMSRRTLNRKLKILLDISPNELIRRYRLQKAAALLASGHGVADTAYSVGFETPSYFTQCFKEQYGQTPSEFAARKTV
ncbi:MAG: helix-turn-helix domain-containing protein [Ferruginibacter sp.]|nr:helix-turn-helix domain-containing protein [Chitinophagaceae bacterium]